MPALSEGPLLPSIAGRAATPRHSTTLALLVRWEKRGEPSAVGRKALQSRRSPQCALCRAIPSAGSAGRQAAALACVPVPLLPEGRSAARPPARRTSRRPRAAATACRREAIVGGADRDARESHRARGHRPRRRDTAARPGGRGYDDALRHQVPAWARSSRSKRRRAKKRAPLSCSSFTVVSSCTCSSSRN
jgi:hypothetical protein